MRAFADRGLVGLPSDLLEIYPEGNVDSVVVRGISIGPVVVGAGAVELVIPGVGDGKIDVLHRPVTPLEDIAGGVWTAVVAPANRGRCIQERIGVPGGPEEGAGRGELTGPVVGAIQF